MDWSAIGTYAGSISFLIHIAQAIFTAINHTSCRSRCCGREGHISIDVDESTPKSKQLRQVLIEPNPMNTLPNPMNHANTMPNLNLHI